MNLNMLNDKEIDLLYQAMCHDSCFPPSREGFNALIEKGEELMFKAKKEIVGHGSIDNNIWIIGKGIARLVYFNDNREITYGFGGQGTLFCSPLSFVKGEVSNFHLIAVTDCVMFKISKADFLKLISSDIEISNWFCGAMIYQIMVAEAKINSQNYPANERVERFMKGMIEEYNKEVNPYLRFNLHQLPMRVLASYFGITRSHMAHLIKDFYDKEADKSTNDMTE
ncbi:MAG: Crp/Fnr family transcriptional regulator [Muribaculaceae bacterium]|nr:Crp/Fnr family transcriptional regulator [Muribaculaceae bacterium]MDE6296398.1 Crp/Fnr family transcriptional regulator [Muribaculaceae bacterium]